VVNKIRPRMMTKTIANIALKSAAKKKIKMRLFPKMAAKFEAWTFVL
jgi:hypothetical protein